MSVYYAYLLRFLIFSILNKINYCFTASCLYRILWLAFETRQVQPFQMGVGNDLASALSRLTVCLFGKFEVHFICFVFSKKHCKMRISLQFFVCFKKRKKWWSIDEKLSVYHFLFNSEAVNFCMEQLVGVYVCSFKNWPSYFVHRKFSVDSEKVSQS